MFGLSFSWIFQICLIFTHAFSVGSFTSPSPSSSPSKEEDTRKRVDDTVIYIIVVIVALFIITVIVIMIVSYFQTKTPPRPRESGQRPPDVRAQRLGGGSARNNHTIINPYVVDPSSSKDLWWEIPANKLKINPNKVLGSGQFGVILLGVVTRDNVERQCAVKTLKVEATDGEKRSLKIELQNMSNMDPHPNIVNLIGAQTLNVQISVVVEYCANGDLYKYLRAHRRDLSWQGEHDSGTSIDSVTRLRIAFDTVNGMNYLATKGFIHRDLAARNVLLDGDLRAKVSDFGRSRDVSETFKIFESLRRKNEPIPTRWMPVETLSHQIFTTKSDVWSFGVLLWEIESGGVRPYNSEQTYRQVVNKVVYQGYRLPQPPYCPDIIYGIMSDCWKFDADERPSFGQLSQIFGNLLKENMQAQSSTC